MRPDRMILSAYLDGEVPDRFVPEIEAAIASSPDVQREYEELVSLRAKLARLPMPDPVESAVRSLVAIRQRTLSPAPQRVVRVPIAVLAFAAALVLALAGALTWSVLGGRTAQEPSYVAKPHAVDVTIRVDGSEMEQVLKWLIDQNMLGEVTIQLPEQRFGIVGEPVLLRAADYPERAAR